ncbi:MAG: choice-of-anchor tandem repeat GloVer-containing protein [Rhizomicrobium sp.]
MGVLFKLSRVVGQRNWMETVLYSFCSQENCADGAYPVGAPLIDQNGNMFGVTGSGGTTQCFNGVVGDCGVLYELTDDGTEKVLYNFCSLQDCKDGLAPYGSLIADASGNLYGTTQAGGGYYDNGYEEFGAGTVFRFSNATLETLHAFCAETNCPDGAYPTTGVAIASFGDLFGTTAEGGPSQSGEVFELKP